MPLGNKGAHFFSAILTPAVAPLILLAVVFHNSSPVPSLAIAAGYGPVLPGKDSQQGDGARLLVYHPRKQYSQCGWGDARCLHTTWHSHVQ